MSASYSQGAYCKRFTIAGRGGSQARVHLHFGWGIDWGSGDIGKICFHQC